MKKAILIVDPQNDFISGSLPVPGADEAMERLAGYLSAANGEYDLKIVTADRHPYHHCSFTDNGGKWPRHCVADSAGAAISDNLFSPLYETAGEVAVLYKGEAIETDEYSIFSNPTARDRIRHLIEENLIERIDICGLAGDVCVLSTLKDGIGMFGEKMFNIMTRFSPSLDNGIALKQFLSDRPSVGNDMNE